MYKKIVYLHIFAFLTGFITNLVHPITPMYIRSLNISDYMFGIFFAVMNLGIFLAAPFWGNLGDNKKRSIIIAIGFLGYGISQFLFGTFSNQYHISIVRFTAGIFTAAFQVSTLAYLLDEEIPNKKTHVSVYLALIVLGASFGYLVGGNLGSIIEAKQIFYLQALSSLVMVVLSLFLKETKKEEIVSNRSAFRSFKTLKELDGKLIFLFIVIIIANISIVNFSKYIDLYINDLNYSTKTIGNINFVSGFITVGVTLIVVPRLLNKFKSIKVSIVALLLSGLFSVIVFLVPVENFLYFMYSTFMIYVAFKTIYEPAMINHINDQKGSTGMLMGLRQSALALGAVIGPIIAGIIYNKIDRYLFVILSSLLVLASFLLMFYQRKSDVK